MFDKLKGYDPSDVKSIENFAVQLENKTFLLYIMSTFVMLIVLLCASPA